MLERVLRSAVSRSNGEFARSIVGNSRLRLAVGILIRAAANRQVRRVFCRVDTVKSCAKAALSEFNFLERFVAFPSSGVQRDPQRIQIRLEAAVADFIERLLSRLTLDKGAVVFDDDRDLVA